MDLRVSIGATAWVGTMIPRGNGLRNVMDASSHAYNGVSLCLETRSRDAASKGGELLVINNQVSAKVSGLQPGISGGWWWLRFLTQL